MIKKKKIAKQILGEVFTQEYNFGQNWSFLGKIPPPNKKKKAKMFSAV